MVSRRALIGGTAAVAAVAALGAGVGFGVLPEPASGLVVLSEEEAGTIRALYDAMFPPGNSFGVAGHEVDLVARLDVAFAEEMEPETMPAFRYILRAISLSPVPTYGARFAELDFAGRRQVLANWTDPGNLPKRMAWEALKVPLAMAWFGQPEVLTSIGWRAECAVGTT